MLRKPAIRRPGPSITRGADLHGWLYIRKRVAFCSIWKRRYFVLTDNILRCFTSPTASFPIQAIDLSRFGAIASDFSPKSPRLMFRILSKKDSISFTAKDAHTFHSWFEALNDYFKENSRPSMRPACRHAACSTATDCELCFPSRLLLAASGQAPAPIRRFSFSFDL